MPQLNNINIKAPSFHWRVNYDQLIKDEIQSHSSMEHQQLLPDMFGLSTIFAEKGASHLEHTIKAVFKKKKNEE
jgi:hypothetical protein